jgi:hypothetical protein
VKHEVVITGHWPMKLRTLGETEEGPHIHVNALTNVACCCRPHHTRIGNTEPTVICSLNSIIAYSIRGFIYISKQSFDGQDEESETVVSLTTQSVKHNPRSIRIP